MPGLVPGIHVLLQSRMAGGWVYFMTNKRNWPAPGSEDTELGVLMELEVGHGEASVYARVQA
jgi:hypothetical protein